MFNQDNALKFKLDPWAASSLLQKAIRRGDVGLAQYAAAVFYRQRGNAIWRRLITIAFEDIGIGDPVLVFELTCLATDRNLRAMLDEDRNIILELCSRLATAPKDRSADYLFSMAVHLSEAHRERIELTGVTAVERIEISIDRDQPMLRRAVATLLSCTEGGKGEKFVMGDALFKFLDPCNAECPSSLLNALGLAAQKSAHPFILMVPILWSDFSKSGAASIVANGTNPQSGVESGIPLYTFDKHTRIGKQAIGMFAQECDDVRAVLAEYVSADARHSVAQMAAFYADAIPISPKLEWAESATLEAAGAEADLTAAGCPRVGIPAVLRTFRDHIEQLDDLRRRIIRREIRK